MLAAAASVGKEIIVLDIRRDSDIDAAFSTLVERGVGLAVGVGAILRGNLDRIVALAALHKIPAIYPFRGYVLGGGLMNYGGRVLDAYQPAGVYVGRILKMLWGGSGEHISIAALTSPMEPRDDETKTKNVNDFSRCLDPLDMDATLIAVIDEAAS